MIRGAAKGRAGDREEFVRRYLPVVRSYLRARWRGSALAGELEDVVQEVFLGLLREGGTLETADSRHGAGFRGLLYGVTRNTALFVERTRARRLKRVGDQAFDADLSPAEEPSLSQIFDRSYALAIMREARREMEFRARAAGERAERRVELLRLRFEENRPVREIAAAWGMEAALVHREYAKAREEFRAALAATVSEAERCTPAQAEREGQRLMALFGS